MAKAGKTAAPAAEPELERELYPVRADQVKPGDVMMFPYWGTVKQTAQNGTKLVIGGLRGGPDFGVDGQPLVEGAYSADFFAITRPVTRTEMCKRLVASINRPFTVRYVKDNGEDRMHRGVYVAHEEMFGRSKILDLDADAKDNFKQVNHRTVYELIVDGIRFVLKR